MEEKPKLKCGIEIHQRLDTNKLFCRCPSILSEGEKPDCQMLRKLRASESEMGELDRAARLEQERQLDFKYDIFKKNCCAMETDEEPPLPIDKEALHLVLGICQQLHMRVVDQIHVMRKIVVDGSNTSGFQRTALVATNGFLETSKGKVGIDSVAIEEESAGILENMADGAKNYRLDRLGIPLIEIATSPDILDGEHCKETAEKIGMILRATGKAARGLGTIRQDVNISIPGGARVEIKGVQDLKLIPQIVDIEVGRQSKLLELLEKRKGNGNRWDQPHVEDLTELFGRTECGMINRGLLSGKRVLGIRLRSHKGALGTEIQPGKRYGTELSDYAKTAGVKGIIHSDEDLSKYKISPEEAQAVMDALNAKESDAFVLVVSEEGMGRMALARVSDRAALKEIPGQTRRVEPDGTTSFMRPLPGRARMYPETDIHSIDINAEILKEALAGAGEGLEAKSDKLRQLLNPEMARRMLKSRNLKLFEKLVAMGVEPMLAAATLEDTLVALRREGVELKKLDSTMEELFKEYLTGSFVKAAIPEIIKKMEKGAGIQEILTENELERITGEELKELIIRNNKDLGLIMRNYRLRVDANEVRELIQTV